MTNNPKVTPRNRLLNATILILRFLIGGVFLLSGLAKAIDTWGIEYKIHDYLVAFDWCWAMPFEGILSVALPIIEFVSGVLLIIGSFRRVTVVILLLFMAFMFPLSAYLWLSNPIPDCGCFGDAWIISNQATFWKNFVITASLVFLLKYNNRVRSFYGPAIQWLTVVLSIMFILPILWYGNVIQPMVDFRPYKIGTSINSTSDSENESFVFTYSKNGITQNFSIDNLPDTTWTFVDRKLIESNKSSNTNTIVIYDDAGEPIEGMVSATEITVLILIPDIENIDALTNFRLNDTYDLLQSNGINMLCLTGCTNTQILQWRELSMSDYPVYRMDDSQLKQIARGNPAVVIIKDGVIVYKSSFIDFILSKDDFIDNNKVSINSLINNNDDSESYLLYLFLLYVLSMFVILLINRSPILIKLGIQLTKNNKKVVTLPLENSIQTLNNKEMRKNIVAGNWKMNTTLQEGVALAKEVNAALATRTPNCDVIICVPFTHLASVKAEIADSLGLGAENCADKVKGAYTGEVSAAMVASTGAKYVILGHSERRQYYHETSEILKEKVALAFENNLTPIFCIGEVLEERENGTYFDIVKKQVEDALFNLSAEDFKKLVLAYEPVWAIGTGKTATADQAEEIHAFIRKTIADKYGAEVAEEISILYGGSCKPSNAKEIFSKPNVDGGLIGGAALKAEDFMGIVDAF